MHSPSFFIRELKARKSKNQSFLPVQWRTNYKDFIELSKQAENDRLWAKF